MCGIIPFIVCIITLRIKVTHPAIEFSNLAASVSEIDNYDSKFT